MFNHMFKRDGLLSVLLGRSFCFVLVFWFDSPQLQRFALCFVSLVLNAYLLFGSSGSMGNGFQIYGGYLYGLFGVVTDFRVEVFQSYGGFLKEILGVSADSGVMEVSQRGFRELGMIKGHFQGQKRFPKDIYRVGDKFGVREDF